RTALAIASATCVTVRSQPKIDAAATIRSTVDVVSIVSMDALTSSFQDSDRYPTRPRNSAQTTAATAASVGVNQPIVMPPIRITGAISAITAENLNSQSSASSETKLTPTDQFAEIPVSIIAQIANGNASTMTISRDALPSFGQENGVSEP